MIPAPWPKSMAGPINRFTRRSFRSFAYNEQLRPGLKRSRRRWKAPTIAENLKTLPIQTGLHFRSTATDSERPLRLRPLFQGPGHLSQVRQTWVKDFHHREMKTAADPLSRDVPAEIPTTPRMIGWGRESGKHHDQRHFNILRNLPAFPALNHLQFHGRLSFKGHGIPQVDKGGHAVKEPPAA